MSQRSPQARAGFQQPAQALAQGSHGRLGRSAALPFRSVWWEKAAEPSLTCPETSARPPARRDLQKAAADARRGKAVLCYAVTLHQ